MLNYEDENEFSGLRNMHNYLDEEYVPEDYGKMLEYYQGLFDYKYKSDIIKEFDESSIDEIEDEKLKAFINKLREYPLDCTVYITHPKTRRTLAITTISDIVHFGTICKNFNLIDAHNVSQIISILIDRYFCNIANNLHSSYVFPIFNYENGNLVFEGEIQIRTSRTGYFGMPII